MEVLRLWRKNGRSPASGTKEKEDDQEGEENGVSSAALAGIRAGDINISEVER